MVISLLRGKFFHYTGIFKVQTILTKTVQLISCKIGPSVIFQEEILGQDWDIIWIFPWIT